MKLFVSEGNPQCVKVLAALELTGAKCDVQLLSPDERVVSFLSRPVLPAAQLPSSQELFSANAICQYLFEVGGKKITDASRQFLEWEATELQPVLLQALHAAVLQGKSSEAGTLLKKPLSWLEQCLSGKTIPFLTAGLTFNSSLTVPDNQMFGLDKSNLHLPVRQDKLKIC